MKDLLEFGLQKVDQNDQNVCPLVNDSGDDISLDLDF